MAENGALSQRLQRLQSGLHHGLIERQTATRLVLLAAISGEHSLLVGPPGTAKSELARRLGAAFEDSTVFERLLTRFSVPEELFGPLSIKGLDEDRYERLTDGYLPTASIAFLDEIFKANSAILNALLTMLNEREFDNGTQRVRTPLVSVIGASNELPQEEELGALYDRFLVRLHIGPVTSDGFGSLLDLTGDPEMKIDDGDRMSVQDLASIRQGSEAVALPEQIKDLLAAMRVFFAEQQIEVSDRRWRKIVKLLKTSAFTDGRKSVSYWDCWLIQHCAWHSPEQRERIAEWYEQRTGEATAHDPGHISRHVEAWEDRLDKDLNVGPQATDKDGNLLYYDEHRKETDRSHGSRKENERVIETMAYSAGHIDGRVENTEKIKVEIVTALATVARLRQSAIDEISSHLWIDSEFSAPACKRLDKQAKALQSLLNRIESTILKFQTLPRELSELPSEFLSLPKTMRASCRIVGQFLRNEQSQNGTTAQELVQFRGRDSWGYDNDEEHEVILTDGDTNSSVLKAVENINRYAKKNRKILSTHFFDWLAKGVFSKQEM